MTTPIKFHKTAYAKIMLHATVNSTTSIHGILVGSTTCSEQTTVLHVHDAIPICHSIPTKPIVDMALRITQAYLDCCNQQTTNHHEIIGWYTANERAGDSKIYPVVWKIVESIQSFQCGTPSEKEKRNFRPIVARIDSESFDNMLQKKCDVDGVFKGFDVFELPSNTDAEKNWEDHALLCECLGEEAGDNWKNVSAMVADACLEDHVVLYDFENQLEGKVSAGLKAATNCDWLRNSHVTKILER